MSEEGRKKERKMYRERERERDQSRKLFWRRLYFNLANLALLWTLLQIMIPQKRPFVDIIDSKEYIALLVSTSL